jgi:hypothetical protein
MLGKILIIKYKAGDITFSFVSFITLWKESQITAGQQFQWYQQHEQSLLTSNHWTWKQWHDIW